MDESADVIGWSFGEYEPFGSVKNSWFKNSLSSPVANIGKQVNQVSDDDA